MEKEKCPKCEIIVSLCGIIFLLMFGSALTLIINFYNENVLVSFPCKYLLKCLTWLIVLTICIFLIQQPIRCLFKLFERMYIIRDEALKNIPIVISVILALFLLPLPIFFIFNKYSAYIDYITVLAPILGLNGLFTFFIASENGKRDGQKNAQCEYKENDNRNWEIKGFKIVNKPEKCEKNFKIEKSILLVYDYLENGSGDNLWNPMNDWHKNYDKNGDYPLFNARSNNWNGNDEWYRQLNEFVNYLREKDLLDK